MPTADFDRIDVDSCGADRQPQVVPAPGRARRLRRRDGLRHRAGGHRGAARGGRAAACSATCPPAAARGDGAGLRRLGPGRATAGRCRPSGSARSPTSSPGCRRRSSTSRPPGTPVVLPTPAYMPFLTVPPALGRELIQVPLAHEDGRTAYDLDGSPRRSPPAPACSSSATRTTRSAGSSTARSSWRSPRSSSGRRPGVRRRDPRPAGVPGRRHVPVRVALAGTAAAHGHRDLGVEGLEPARAQVRPAGPQQRRGRRALGRVGFLSEHGASTLGVVANTAAYDQGGPWLDDVLAYLDGNRRLLAELLAEQLPGVGYTPPEGTYLAWLDFRALGLGRPRGLLPRRRRAWP